MSWIGSGRRSRVWLGTGWVMVVVMPVVVVVVVVV